MAIRFGFLFLTKQRRDGSILEKDISRLLSDVTEAGGVFLCRLKSVHNEGERSMSMRTACIVLLTTRVFVGKGGEQKRMRKRRDKSPRTEMNGMDNECIPCLFKDGTLETAGSFAQHLQRIKWCQATQLISFTLLHRVKSQFALSRIL